MNTDLISKAVSLRLAEVRDRVKRLDPQSYGEMGFFVTSVKEALLDQPDRITRLTPFTAPQVWSLADSDCLTSLRVLALHGPRTLRPEPGAPSGNFLDQLQTTTAARESIFALLSDRYAWPLNFSFRTEESVREYLLMRLMTSDRTRVEKNAAAVDVDVLLLKLNLISVHAATTNDLRFLDALNYYYELLTATKFPESKHAWLLISWYALYARALNFWSKSR